MIFPRDFFLNKRNFEIFAPKRLKNGCTNDGRWSTDLLASNSAHQIKKKSLKKHELNKKEIIKMKRAKALSGTPLPIWLRTWLKP